MESIKCALIIIETESTIIRIDWNIFILSNGKMKLSSILIHDEQMPYY